QRRSGIPARSGDPTARAVGVRLPAVLPLDPRDAESPALLGAARLLPRVLRHPVHLATRLMVQRAAGRGATHDLRGDGDLLPLLRGVPFLPGGGAALHLRARAQRGDVRLAGARHAEIGRAPSELQSLAYLVCRLLLEKKKKTI